LSHSQLCPLPPIISSYSFIRTTYYIMKTVSAGVCNYYVIPQIALYWISECMIVFSVLVRCHGKVSHGREYIVPIRSKSKPTCNHQTGFLIIQTNDVFEKVDILVWSSRYIGPILSITWQLLP
jgi:hypothetical protein